jgi:hypothetical protein
MEKWGLSHSSAKIIDPVENLVSAFNIDQTCMAIRNND